MTQVTDATIPSRMSTIDGNGRLPPVPEVDLQLPTREQADALVAQMRERDMAYLRFEFPDMAGISRGKTVPINHVVSYMTKGLNLYGGTVCLDSYSIPVRGSGYNEEMTFTDCAMVVDPDSLTPVPWLENTGRVICDTMWYDGRPQMAAPRLLLKRMLGVAEALGYDVRMGHEYEFYVVDPVTKEPIYNGQPIFITQRTHQFRQIDDLIRTLQQCGIDIITYNAEHGPGQMELNYDSGCGIPAADKAFIFKSTVKEALRDMGLLATFMTKPYKKLSGSCSHFHVSLVSRETGENLFLDRDEANGMSDTLKSFIQGVLDHARAAMALWSPTTNCYRRIRPHTYAPSNVSWGVEDRSASVRVKASKDEREHIEVRVPSALSNPYLTASATLAAGLLGVVQRRELAPLCDGPKEDNPNFPRLPRTLDEALEALLDDAPMRYLLGEEFIKAYTQMKSQEAARFSDEIPACERDEYLEMY